MFRHKGKRGRFCNATFTAAYELPLIVLFHWLWIEIVACEESDSEVFRCLLVCCWQFQSHSFGSRLFSAARQDATEHRVNKRNMSGNMAFCVSLFDILYPKSTQWPEFTEPGGCQVKGMKDYLHLYRDPEIQEYQKVLQKGAFLPSRGCSSHLKATAFTPTEPFWLVWKMETTLQRENLEQKNGWCWCRRRAQRSGCWENFPFWHTF